MANIKTLKRPSAASKPQKWGKSYNREVYASARWKRMSLNHRINNPLCVMCGEPGDMTDHIKPIQSGGAIWDSRNFQTLCSKCHTVKTNQERNALKNKGV